MSRDRNIKIELNSLKEFYEECKIVENYNVELDPFCDFEFNKYRESADWEWIGEEEEVIRESKFSYTKGLDELEKIDKDIVLGGSKTITKWSDDDGDDMSFDRLIEGLPSMKQRIRSNGYQNGKFVTIHVGISENSSISNKQMMHKAYTCVRIIDLFEALNYRVKVLVEWRVRDIGSLPNGDNIKKMFVSIMVKDFNEPLVKPTILASISTWMLRYHLFEFAGNKFICEDGMGVSIHSSKKDTLHNIYIDQGDCLCKDYSDAKIKSIINLLEEAGA